MTAPQGAYTLRDARDIARRCLVALGCPTSEADIEHALQELFAPYLQDDVRRPRFDVWSQARPLLESARTAAGMPVGTEPIPPAAKGRPRGRIRR